MSNGHFKVEWSESARSDLAAIVRYIAEEDPGQALIILKQLKRKSISLASLPKRGRIVPELRAVGLHSYHELISSPWRIIYKIDIKTVYVMAVLDNRRDLQDLLLQRLTF